MQVQYTTCSYAVEYTLCFADGILVGAVTHISEILTFPLASPTFLEGSYIRHIDMCVRS